MQATRGCLGEQREATGAVDSGLVDTGRGVLVAIISQVGRELKPFRMIAGVECIWSGWWGN